MKLARENGLPLKTGCNGSSKELTIRGVMTSVKQANPIQAHQVETEEREGNLACFVTTIISSRKIVLRSKCNLRIYHFQKRQCSVPELKCSMIVTKHWQNLTCCRSFPLFGLPNMNSPFLDRADQGSREDQPWLQKQDLEESSN